MFARREGNFCDSIATSQMTSKPEVERQYPGSPGSPLLGTLIFRGPEFGNIVPGAFTPVLAKHSKSFSLMETKVE